MPNGTNKSGEKKQRVDKTKLMTRIVVFILAILMVLGSCAMAIMYGLASDTATDAPSVASAALYSENQQIRVGLAYGSSAKFSAALKATGGFSFGFLKTDNSYTEVWQVTDETVSVACDFHLSGSGSSYSIGSEGSADVGGFHICLSMTSTDSTDLVRKVEDALADGSAFGSGKPVSGVDYYAFPGMINGKYAVLVGDFSTDASAQSAMAPLLSEYPNASVVGPYSDGVTVVGTDGRIRFDYQPSSDGALFGVQAKKSTSVITYGSYQYNGVFEFCRSSNTMRIVNVVPLERYVEGVLPYEISRSWPAEAQKAFSVTVRNYALTHIGVHKKNNFDVCSTTCCQVYRGCTKVNQTVIDCVAATKGIVSTYNGTIQQQWYSSSVGGTTVDVADAWGGRSYPYLHAIATPWEKYTEHSNGSWTTEYTPSRLASVLRNSGYSTLTGDIQSVKINAFSENSSYVISITVTDVYGHSVTIKNSDMIRADFGLKSANFVVGKAGETVSVTDYGLLGYGDFASASGETYPAISIMTGTGGKTVTAASALWAMTQTGKKQLNAVPSLWIRNATDVNRFLTKDETAIELPKTEKSGLLDFSKLTPTSRVRQITLSGTSGNFVFVGRGWGHGVGSSQYGYYDLAVMGYTWDEIIRFYYGDSVLQQYTTLS